MFETDTKIIINFIKQFILCHRKYDQTYVYSRMWNGHLLLDICCLKAKQQEREKHQTNTKFMFIIHIYAVLFWLRTLSVGNDLKL